MNNLYEEYGQIDAQIEELEQKKATLRPLIAEQIIRNGGKPVETGYGKFTASLKKIFTYSEKVESIEKEAKEKVKEINDSVKAEKAREESTGEATYVEEPQLRFIAMKF